MADEARSRGAQDADRSSRPAHDRGPLHGVPHLDQGPLRHQGHGDDRCVPRARGARRRCRRARHHLLTPRRRRLRRQDQPARVRVRHDERRLRVRPGAKSVRHHALARRIERRLGRERRRRNGARLARHRHRRFNPHPCRGLRHRRPQAHLRRGVGRRRRAALAHARSRGAARANGDGRLAHLSRARRTPGLARARAHADRGPSHRRAAQVFLRRAGRRCAGAVRGIDRGAAKGRRARRATWRSPMRRSHRLSTCSSASATPPRTTRR